MNASGAPPIGTLHFDVGFNQASLKKQIEDAMESAAKGGIEKFNRAALHQGLGAGIKKFSGLDDLESQITKTLEKGYQRAIQAQEEYKRRGGDGAKMIANHWRIAYEDLQKAGSGITEQIARIRNAEQRLEDDRKRRGADYRTAGLSEGVADVLGARPSSSRAFGMPAGSDFQSINWTGGDEDAVSRRARNRREVFNLMRMAAMRYGGDGVGDVLGGASGVTGDLMGLSYHAGMAGKTNLAGMLGRTAIGGGVAYGTYQAARYAGAAANYLESTGSHGYFRSKGDWTTRSIHDSGTELGHVFARSRLGFSSGANWDRGNWQNMLAPQEMREREKFAATQGRVAGVEASDAISRMTNEENARFSTRKTHQDRLRELDYQAEDAARPSQRGRSGFFRSELLENLLGGEPKESEANKIATQRALAEYSRASKAEVATRRELQIERDTLAKTVGRDDDPEIQRRKARINALESRLPALTQEREIADRHHQIAARRQRTSRNEQIADHKRNRDAWFDGIKEQKVQQQLRRNANARAGRAANRAKTMAFVGGLSDRNKAISDRLWDLKRKPTGVMGVSDVFGFQSGMQSALQAGMEKEKEIKNLEAQKLANDALMKGAVKLGEVTEKLPGLIEAAKGLLGFGD